MTTATWTKSVVRETSFACGLKTSRPPETILIPGRRGVGRSRSRGKSRTIVEDRSNPLGQVPLVKEGSILFCATHLIFSEYLSLVWKQEWRLVKKGWFAASARILFSVIVHSTSSSWMITSFFSTWMFSACEREQMRLLDFYLDGKDFV